MKRNLTLDEKVRLSVRTAFNMHKPIDGYINKQSKLSFTMMSKLDFEIYINVGNTIYESMCRNIRSFIKGTTI
jgi:hypothetical protein